MKRKFSSFSPPKSAGKENKIRWKSHFRASPLTLLRTLREISEVIIFYLRFVKAAFIPSVWPTHKRPDCLRDKRTLKSVHKLSKRVQSPRNWAV